MKEGSRFWPALVLTGVLSIALSLTGCGRAPTPFVYSIRVGVKDTGESLSKATVQIMVSGKPPLFTITDATGFASISIPSDYDGQAAILHVEAAGYEAYEQNISLNAKGLAPVVQLEPKGARATPMVTLVPSPMFSPTPGPVCEAISEQHWEAAHWGPAEKATGIEVTEQGRLKASFDGTRDPVQGDYKATFFTGEVPANWAGCSSLTFDVDNTLGASPSLEVTIAVATGEGSCWNESTLWTRVEPGQHHLVFPLNTNDYKRCPSFDVGEIKDRSYVRRLHLVFLLKEPAAGTIYIDNVRLEK